MAQHHWIGVRLHEHGAGFSPVGAKITVGYAGMTQVASIVTGDSYRAQHANTRHFDPGPVGEVRYIDVRWPNGKTTRPEEPVVDRYDVVQPK